MTATPAPAIPDEGEALAACPRCGGRAFVTVHFGVWCEQDRCLTLSPRADRAAAIAAWNTRAPSAEIARLTAALGEAVEALEPFATFADRIPDRFAAATNLWNGAWADRPIANVSDFKRASATLARIRPAGGPSHE